MLYDLNSEFGTDSESNLQQVLAVNGHKISRNFAARWPENLRFLCVADAQDYPEDTYNASDANASPTARACSCERKNFFTDIVSALRVTSKNPPEVPGCTHYVAISYCWKAQDEALPKYTVQTQHLQRRNIAPSVIIDRAIAFATHHKIKLIWIDQECIVQEDRDDKEQGIQSMDLVYQRSSHPVALLSRPIASQAHLSALLMSMASESEMQPSDFWDALEALENIAQDKWFSRTWCFQEVVAVGESMKLLIPCNVDFQSGDEYRQMRGEFEVPVQVLREMATWVHSWVESMWQYNEQTLNDLYGAGFRERAGSVYTRITQICPVAYSQGSGEQDPEFRYGCNAAYGLHMMQEKQNRRVADRLAILANICNFQKWLNTHKLEEAESQLGSEFSFSLCATVLALINGDISIQVGSRVEAEKRGSPSAQPLSWLPLEGIPLERIQYFDEFHGQTLRLPDVGFCEEGLTLSGFLWRFDRNVDMSDIQGRYSETWDPAFIKGVTTPWSAGTGETDDPNNVLREAFFFIMLKLCTNNLIAVANAIWHCIRPTSASIVNSDDGPTEIWSGEWEVQPQWLDVPDRFDEILSPLLKKSDDDPLSIQEQYDKHLKHFFFSDDLTFDRGYSWLVHNIMQTGHLPVWSLAATSTTDLSSSHSETPLAVFDCQVTTDIGLTPACEQLESHPRSRLAIEPIAWVVEETGQVVGGEGKLVHGRTMTRGAWRTYNASPTVYVIGT